MYPKMIEEAKAEANALAERSFVYANEVEKIMQTFIKRLLSISARTKILITTFARSAAIPLKAMRLMNARSARRRNRHSRRSTEQ